MKLRRLALVLSLGVTALPACAVEATEGTATMTEDELATSTNKRIRAELEAAVTGLESGGGEGDPTPYQVVDFQLGRGESTTDKVLLDKLLPKLGGFEGRDPNESFPGMQGADDNMAQFWSEQTATPQRGDFSTDAEFARAKEQAQKWKKVRAVFEKNLVKVRSVTLGYAMHEGGSIETGVVAQVVVGVTRGGRLFAIYAHDVWT